MTSSTDTRRIATSLALLFVAGSAGCHRDGPHGFEIFAPGFETSRVRFESYAYSPVGAFADKRGLLVPFMDSDGDGRFDPRSEAAGRCDLDAHRCSFDHARLQLLMTTTDCPTTTGTWLLGDVYDRDGRSVHATLCDDRGSCAEAHEHAFQDTGSVNAIWLPGSRAEPEARVLSLRAGREQIHYTNVALPQPIRLVDFRVEHPGDLQVSVAADQTIDMVALWVRHGDTMHWSSARHPEALQVHGTTLVATVPHDVLEACAAGCETYMQIAHVWRDDEVFSLAEIKHRVE